MSYGTVRGINPTVANAPVGEREWQNGTLVIVASKNHVSEAVMEARSSGLTDNYAESYPGSRYYGGCEYTDEVEQLVIDRAKEFWGAEHVNVQPYLGSQANMGAFLTVLDLGDKILFSDLTHGGHLNHGYPVNVTGKTYEIEQYKVSAETDYVDHDQPAVKAKAFDPDIIISGYSAYPWEVERECVQAMADSVDAYHLADIAYIAGLVTAGEHSSPIDTADSVTGSTHKTIWSGHGGIVTCDEEHADDVDSAVFLGLQSKPILHNVAGKVVGFGEALTPEFEEYASQVVNNAATLNEQLQERGLKLVSEGADTHLALVDLRPSHPDTAGKDMEAALEKVGIVLNANTVPGEGRSASNPGGVRAGTPMLTTRGSDEEACRAVVGLVYEIIDVPRDKSVEGLVDQKVDELAVEYPLYD